MSNMKQLALRVPADVKAWLEEQAARNGSSQNSEVIRAVRERMDKQEAAD
ncbi:MAG: Arc family DNA-binding protein [Paracoccus sp. (in: a-proteobacteria)]|nr:Arc family DNA-binding protein [Paracoccus sp. (in: a-proteobacteria)]MDO5613623.1 Arc family DNA-binding protein [Paracoccus sp. (in: a-proteobacteria)]